MINLHERLLPTSVGVEPATSSRTAHPIEPPRPLPLFKEHKVCSFDSGDGSCMLYVITLKEFNHILCEVLDLDLKGQAQVQGSS